ncbi:DUF3987 domain-containing protein [bacterium]|nr:DUF3987 domain-containing protein [bacterium]
MKIDLSKYPNSFVTETVSVLSEYVESNSESLLIQLLAGFGNCIGRGAYFKAAEDYHYPNLFVLLVGNSSRGRKGQSLNLVKSLLTEIDSDWAKNHIAKGLSSSEGLKYRIRDQATIDENTFVEIRTDNMDKRLLCIESEFASVLKQSQREGNTLSPTLREAWDSNNLDSMTKVDPIKVTQPMISIIGHITQTELVKTMNQNDSKNGFGNRIIFIKSKSDKRMPDPKTIDPEIKKYLVDRIKLSVTHGKKIGLVKFDTPAKIYWEKYYMSINQEDCTLVGILTAREEPQVRRLALIIALYDGKSEIDLDSLKMAIEIYKYSKQTLLEIYGNKTGDNFQDKIIEILKTYPDGLSRTDLTNILSRNYQKCDLDTALRLLTNQGLVVSNSAPTAGRPQTIYKINLRLDEINELSPP